MCDRCKHLGTMRGNVQVHDTWAVGSWRRQERWGGEMLTARCCDMAKAITYKRNCDLNAWACVIFPFHSTSIIHVMRDEDSG